MGVLCDIGAGMYGGCRTEGTGHGCATLERAGGARQAWTRGLGDDSPTRAADNGGSVIQQFS